MSLGEVLGWGESRGSSRWDESAPGLNSLFLQEELTSTSVEHIIVNPNAAYDKFKDKRVGTKGLGETGWKLDGEACPQASLTFALGKEPSYGSPHSH